MTRVQSTVSPVQTTTTASGSSTDVSVENIGTQRLIRLVVEPSFNEVFPSFSTERA